MQSLQVRQSAVPAPLELNPQRKIVTTYLVNPETGEQYEYPKCLFDGSWAKEFAQEKFGRGGAASE